MTEFECNKEKGKQKADFLQWKSVPHWKQAVHVRILESVADVLTFLCHMKNS